MYGLYHATVLSGYDLFSRWNRIHHVWGDSLPWRVASVLLTCHVVCFGLFIFSGHFAAQSQLQHVGLLEHADCREISGWAWDQNDPNAPISVNISDGTKLLMTVSADEFRQDLQEAGYGTGRHAFMVKTPPLLNDGRLHRVRVTIAGTKRTLEHSGIEVVCP